MEYRKQGVFRSRRDSRSESENGRNLRLGIEVKNHRRNQIRIAPVKGSNMEPGLLSGRIREVEKWIKDYFSQVKSVALPRKFTIKPEVERPQIGEPFDVLWVKFGFDNDQWDDQVMWDIRYLLMGSKLNKLPGFPNELSDIREKLYISRD